MIPIPDKTAFNRVLIITGAGIMTCYLAWLGKEPTEIKAYLELPFYLALSYIVAKGPNKKEAA